MATRQSSYRCYSPGLFASLWGILVHATYTLLYTYDTFQRDRSVVVVPSITHFTDILRGSCCFQLQRRSNHSPQIIE